MSKSLSELIEASYTQKYEIENTRRTKDMAPLVCIDVIHYDRMKRVAIELAKACESNLSAHKSGCVDYRGCECWWQNAYQAISSAKDIIGEVK